MTIDEVCSMTLDEICDGSLPDPGDVALNVPVGNTVGTAVLTEADVEAALAAWAAAAISGTPAAGSPGALWQNIGAPASGATPATGLYSAIGTIAGGSVGPGGISVAIVVKDTNGNPLAGVASWITSDPAGAITIAGTLDSNSLGSVAFMLSAGVNYLWRMSPTYNFPNPQPITVEGSSMSITFADGTPITAPPAGAYCQRSDVENIFGIPNVATWALLSTNDPNSTAGLAEVAARIALEIQVQTAEIDDHLREGGFTLPLVVNESTISVVRLCATLVGVALYENRGTIDYNHETGRVEHRYQFKKDWANKRLDEIRSGKIRWDAERPAGASTGPMAQQTPRRRYGQQQDGLGNYGISGGNNY
jgi:hypothetical protein